MSTDFSQWNPTAANQESDSTYQADAQRSGGAVSGVFASLLANKVFYQVTTFIRAFCLMLVNKGFTPVDGTSPFTADTSSNTAVTALATVLANVLTLTDRPTPLRDAVLHTHTGTTTLDTITTLGPTAALSSPQLIRISSFFSIVIQGAGTTTVGVYVNGSAVATFNFTSSVAGEGFFLDLMLNPHGDAMTYKLTNGVTGAIQSGNIGSGLTSGTLTFAIKAQNANNSDEQFFDWTLLEIL